MKPNYYVAHPWHGLELGPKAPDELDVFIELTPQDTVKYEIDKASGFIRVDRPQKYSNRSPTLYGFIPRTYAGDNDPLDVLVLCQEDIEPLSLVNCYAIGVIKMIDSDQVDEKIIAIAIGDPSLTQYKDISELPAHLLNEMGHFFEIYKSLEGKKTYILDIGDKTVAEEIIQDSMKRYKEIFNK